MNESSIPSKKEIVLEESVHSQHQNSDEDGGSASEEFWEEEDSSDTADNVDIDEYDAAYTDSEDVLQRVKQSDYSSSSSYDDYDDDDDDADESCSSIELEYFDDDNGDLTTSTSTSCVEQPGDDEYEVIVEKWLERDADDPDDYDDAVRRLNRTIYGDNDPDHDVDTMLRRSSLKDLYTYLKQHYWYLVHTNQLDENALMKNHQDLNDNNNKSNHISNQRMSNEREAIEEFLLSRSSSNRVVNYSKIDNLPKSTSASRIHPKEENYDVELSSESNEARFSSNEESFAGNTDDCYDEPRSPRVDESDTVRRESYKREILHEFNESDSEFDSDSEFESEYEDYVLDNEHSVGRENIISEDHSDSSYDSLREERFALYTKEYNKALAKQEEGGAVDEDRLYLLELAVRDRLGEELTNDEQLELKEFDLGENLEQAVEDESPSLSTEERSPPTATNNLREQICCNNDTTNCASYEYEGDQSMSMGDFVEFNNARYMTGASISVNDKSYKETTSGENSLSMADLYMSKRDHGRSDITAPDTKTVCEEKCNRQQDIPLSMIGNTSGISTGSSCNHTSELNDQHVGNNNNSVISLNQLREIKTDLEMIHKNNAFEYRCKPLKIPVNDPKELEWRKKKIEEDIQSIIEKAEEKEIKDVIDTEVVFALKSSALKLALTKKYFDSFEKIFVYYPSVAKALYDFPLIEEAEMILRDEIPFDIATALCTIAASHIKSDDTNGVDENDDFIKKATVSVILDNDKAMVDSFVEMAKSTNKIDENNEDIIKASVDDNVHRDYVIKSTQVAEVSYNKPSKTEIDEQHAAKIMAENSTELQSRLSWIKSELESLIEDAEKNDIDENFDDKAVDALMRAANRIVFVKKYYNIMTDKFIYFPSVADTVLDYSLIEEAQYFYLDGQYEFPLEYTSALRATAARIIEASDSNKLYDDCLMNMAVSINFVNECEEYRSFKVNLTKSDDETVLVNDDSNNNDPQSKCGDFDLVKNGRVSLNLKREKATKDFKHEKKKLENDRKIAEADVGDEASHCLKKWLEDDRIVDRALADLEARRMSELDRLEKDSSLFKMEHKIEMERVENERREIESQFLVYKTDYSQNRKSLEEKLTTAETVLELERNNTDTGMKLVDQDQREGDSRGFFGFGSKKKMTDLALEKRRQKKLIEFKLREIKLEKEVDDIKSEMKNIKEQAIEQEDQVAIWLAELGVESRHLEEVEYDTTIRFEEQMEKCIRLFEEEKRKLTMNQEIIERAIERTETELEERLEDSKRRRKKHEIAKQEAYFSTTNLSIGHIKDTCGESNTEDEQLFNKIRSNIKEKMAVTTEEAKQRIDADNEIDDLWGMNETGVMDHSSDSTNCMTDNENNYNVNHDVEEKAVSKIFALDGNRYEDDGNDNENKFGKNGPTLPINIDATTVGASSSDDNDTTDSECSSEDEENIIRYENNIVNDDVSYAPNNDSDSYDDDVHSSSSLIESNDDHHINDGNSYCHTQGNVTTDERERNTADDDSVDSQYAPSSMETSKHMKNDDDDDDIGGDGNYCNEDYSKISDFNKIIDQSLSSSMETAIDFNTGVGGNDDSASDNSDGDTLSSFSSVEGDDDHRDSDDSNTYAKTEAGWRNDNHNTRSDDIDDSNTINDDSEDGDAQSLPLATGIGDDYEKNEEHTRDENIEYVKIEGNSGGDINTGVKTENINDSAVRSLSSMVLTPINTINGDGSHFDDGDAQFSSLSVGGDVDHHNNEIDDGKSCPNNKEYATLIQVNTSNDADIDVVVAAAAAADDDDGYDSDAKSPLSSIESDGNHQINDSKDTYYDTKVIAAEESGQRKVEVITKVEGGAKEQAVEEVVRIAAEEKDQFRNETEQEKVEIKAIIPEMVLQDAYSAVNDICAVAKHSNQLETVGRQDEVTCIPLDQEQLTEKISTLAIHVKKDIHFGNSPASKTLEEKRRKVVEARERALSIRMSSTLSFNSDKSKWPFADNQNVTSPSSLLSEQQNESYSQRIHHMIREVDRLSGFIRRYESKLEVVCKSLLRSSSSVVFHGEERQVSELSLQEMFNFIIDQDWYKAHFLGTISAGFPRLFISGTRSVTRNSVLLTENNTKEIDGVESDAANNDVSYTVTKIGRTFLKIDAPVQGDVGRFLSYLANAIEGRTRNAILGHWKETAIKLSRDTQSTRVCYKLNEIIAFCLDSQMIEQKK